MKSKMMRSTSPKRSTRVSSSSSKIRMMVYVLLLYQSLLCCCYGDGSNWYLVGATTSSTSSDDNNNNTDTNVTSTITNNNNDNPLYNTILTSYPDKYYRAPNDRRINDTYIIVLNRTLINESITNTRDIIRNILDSNPNGINTSKVLDGMQCCIINLIQNFGNGTTSDERRISILLRLLKNKYISYIEEDQIIRLDQQNSDNNTTSSTDGAMDNTTDTSSNFTGFILSQQDPTWGLDRIDQLNLPLNRLYHANYAGTNVTAYVIDTGIVASHDEFQNGRASCDYSAIQFEDCTDQNGHGTHVAGTIGGITYGVAKEVTLIGVKVLSNDGVGSNSAVMDGVNYVLQQKLKNKNSKMVVNMSLGGSFSRALDRAVANMIEAGIFVAVAAGNSDMNACASSPARLPTAMTVGATDIDDRRADYSNWGPCVDIFGPGTDITSAWWTSNTATKTISGTSMASPHIAGWAALYLSAYNEPISPQSVMDLMLNDATPDIVVDPKDSPNLFINTEALFQTAPVVPQDASNAAATLDGTFRGWLLTRTLLLHVVFGVTSFYCTTVVSIL